MSPKIPSLASSRSAVIGLAFATLAACNAPVVVVQPVHRLVDPVFTADTESNLPPRPDVKTTAARSKTSAFQEITLDNDTRFVLASPAHELISLNPKLPAPADGKMNLVREVPPSLVGADSIIVVPTLRIGGEAVGLDAVLATARASDGKLSIPLVLPPAARGRDINLSLDGYALTWPKRVRLLTGPLAIPQAARFETTIGVLNPLNVAISGAFTVNVCEGSVCKPILAKTVEAASGRGNLPWETIAADLEEYAGKSVRFEFISETSSPGDASKAFLLWANPTVFALQEKRHPGKATNVLLISLDTLAAGHMGIYGYARDTTPKMERRFGEDGTVFEHCVAMATATAPAHMTMMTGLYPMEHNVTDGMKIVDPDLPLLAERIRAAGVETAAFTEDGWLSVSLGFGKGFNIFSEDRSPNVSAPEGRVERTFGLAREWIASNHDKPFFLFLHTFQVHDPYVPPAAYQGKPAGGALPGDEALPSRVLEERLAYDREIRYVDDELDLLLAELDKAGIAQDTLVIVVSDHGEAFGEHGWLLHGNYAYEEVLHVPMMMRGAGVEPGQRIEELVGHVDLTPTILSMLGIPYAPSGLRGISLAPYLAGDRPPKSDRTLFAESWGGLAVNVDHEPRPFLPPALVARRGKHKLARYRTTDGFRFEAYDLAKDPGERDNIIDERAGEFAELRKQLEGYEAEAGQARAARLLGKPQESGDVKLAPDQEEKLRALGYLQ